MPSSNSIFRINVFVWVGLFPPMVVMCCASQVKLLGSIRGREERFLYMLLHVSYCLVSFAQNRYSLEFSHFL